MLINKYKFINWIAGFRVTFGSKSGNMLSKFPSNPQLNIFETALSSFINLDHELCQLAGKINWERFDKEFDSFYSETGRPAHPIRRMAGLLILKQVKNLSDEIVIKTWVENPYFQYFCGEVNFQKKLPCALSELTNFRNRIGEHGSEIILSESIQIHGNEMNEDEVFVDTTVQEKNITYPSDTKLHIKIIKNCNKLARKGEIPLRQTYIRTLKKLRYQLRFKRSKKQKEHAKKAARKIKAIAGRLTRELQRKSEKITLDPLFAILLTEELNLFNRVLAQKQNDKKKIYSLHEPHVECISKGKEHKKYEFGNKSSIVRSKRTGLILGAMAYHGNPYDGHTLENQLIQVNRLTGKMPKKAIVDRGYRGVKINTGTEIIHPSQSIRGLSDYQRRKRRLMLQERSSIEPVIGHLKTDHRMVRNYLKGTIGDKINTILAGAAFNFKKWLNKVISWLYNWQLPEHIFSLLLVK